jgi:putative ABC transport system ATP-binding protein
MPFRTEALTKQFPHADGPVDALRDVTLDIPEGAFAAITGRSGSGKSTLLHVLGGLLRPTAGRLFFRDLALHDLSDAGLAEFRRRHVGFVMQSFNLIPYLTAAENVEVPLSLLGVGAAQRRRQAEDLLGAVGLLERRNHLPRELSVGQQQRVAVARAFAKGPAVILADEPTGNLDPGLAEEVLDLLGRLNRERGTTIVMVTHSPEAARRGTLQVRLKDGRVEPAAAAAGHPAAPATARLRS